MALQKAVIENVDTHKTIKCLFNPTEYSIAKTNNWTTKPSNGKNVPDVEFSGGGASTLTLQLFFDVNEIENKTKSAGEMAKKSDQKRDVRDYIDELWKLALVDPAKKNAKTQQARPPLCIFQWGQTWHFKAVVTSLSVRYTLFREDGTPIRATADVTFQEAEDGQMLKRTNPTSYSEPGLRRREVRPKDTLATIAYEEYGDPNHWRKIAAANAMEDPLDLYPGQVLAIPSIS
jgi:hypothetical protein